MFKLTVRRIGKSLGITLPAAAVRALRVKECDPLFLTKSPDGFSLSPHDPEFAMTMKTADDFMRRYKNALRDLAK